MLSYFKYLNGLLELRHKIINIVCVIHHDNRSHSISLNNAIRKAYKFI